MMMEDDEDVLIFKDDKESDLLIFVKKAIKEFVSHELRIDD